jgi:hypothetical protein
MTRIVPIHHPTPAHISSNDKANSLDALPDKLPPMGPQIISMHEVAKQLLLGPSSENDAIKQELTSLMTTVTLQGLKNGINGSN